MSQVFKTPDGKEFTSKKDWRNYMVQTFYSFTKKVNEPKSLMKMPGEVGGQSFDIADCENSTLIVMDATEQVQIDCIKGCKVFIGACASSIFIRNCSDCVFYTCCRQLRLREVVNCSFHIYSMGEVHIEYSNNVRFGPFNGGYPEQLEHFEAVKLNRHHNLWYDIYDHNDPGKTHANWSLIPESEYGQPWFPGGVPCEPCVPITKSGSVEKPQEENMQSFSLQQMMQDSKAPPVTVNVNTPILPPCDIPTASPPLSTTTTTTSTITTTAKIDSNATDEQLITEVLKQFASFKAGNDLALIATDDFCLLLPDGKTLSFSDLSVTAPTSGNELWHVQKTQVIPGGTQLVAYSSFWICEDAGVRLNTGVLTKNTDKWRLMYVHKSALMAVSKAPIKQVF